MIDDHRLGARTRFQAIQRREQQGLCFFVRQRAGHQAAENEIASSVGAQDAIDYVLRRRARNRRLVGQRAKRLVQAPTGAHLGQRAGSQQQTITERINR